MTTTTDEGAALLRAVLERPDDDLARLVMADWLDEHDQPERAEFIRLACRLASEYPKHATAPAISAEHWHQGQEGCPPCGIQRRLDALFDSLKPDLAADLPGDTAMRMTWTDGRFELQLSTMLGRSVIGHVFRRGFVSEVRLSLAAFVGGPCEVCNGAGDLGTLAGRMGCTRCSAGYDCRGTGTVEGVAAWLFAAHPVTAVTLVDREPLVDSVRGPGRPYSWHRGRVGERWAADLPDGIFYRIPEWNRTGNYSFHDTREAALSALSDAAVRYGRELAGLTNGGGR